MALKDILNEVAADIGIKLSVASERSYLIDKINKAAQELYETNELVNCLREQIFNVGSDEQQIVLPWYISKIRAIRSYECGTPISQVDMRPRYQTDGWNPPFLNWRLKQESFPLERDLDGETYLKFTLSKPSVETFKIIVTGSNSDSSKIQETIIFLAGDTTKQTVNTFDSVESIHKNVPTAYDITVTDIDDNKVSHIPNSELQASYSLVQVLERNRSFSQDFLVEVLFKQKFTPFANDYDSFPCGNIYDKAIYWKTMEHLYAKGDSEIALAKAVAAYSKCKGVIEAIASNSNVGLSLKINFSTSRFANLVDKSSSSYV